MKLAYYNQEIDKILWDIIGNDSFTESNLSDLIDLVTDTIYEYDQNISKPNLELVVQFMIEHKYQKYYVYDLESEFNQVTNDKVSSDKSDNSVKSVKVTNFDKPDESNEPIDSEKMSIDESDLKNADNDSENNIAKYINPELESIKSDKIQLNYAEDLVSHRHDYKHAKFKEAIYIKRRKRIVELKQIPQHEQKSDAWLNQRKESLTATAVAIALDEDPYKYPIQLLLDKCDRGEPFVENENVHHGKKYEQIGNMFYSFRNNVAVAEYGLIQHTKNKFVACSPDGICEKNTNSSDKLTKLVGRLLEIKFPKTRKINTEGSLNGDICPHYYFIQVQTQLYVTEMDECDFLQCKMEEYDSWKDFIADSNPNIPGLSKKTNLEKGCLIQLLPKQMVGIGDPKMCLYNAKYIYPPKLHMTNDETEKWIAHEILHFHTNELYSKYLVDRVIYWRLEQVACHLIKADTQWFESIIPRLKQFWDYVLFYREHPKKLDRLMKYIKEIKVDNSEEIFRKVHKDYVSVHSDTKYQPLYQEENEWRKLYNKKKESYNNYQKFNKNTYDKKKKIVDV